MTQLVGPDNLISIISNLQRRLFLVETNTGIASNQAFNGVITSGQLPNGGVGTEHIAPGAITSAQLAQLAILASHISDGAITATKISAHTIDANHIKSKSINTQHIMADAIVAEHITADAITAEKILAGEIKAEHISADTIDADHIKADNITATHIKADEIQAEHLAVGAVRAEHIDTGSINTDHLSAQSIAAGAIQADAISAFHIEAHSITADEIAANTITAQEIAANTITADEIVATSVASATVTVGTITAVLSIADTAMSDAILSRLITASNISTGGLSAVSATMGTVTGGIFRTSGTANAAKVAMGTSIAMPGGGTLTGLVGLKDNNDVSFKIDASTGEAYFAGQIVEGATGLGNLDGLLVEGQVPTGAAAIIDGDRIVANSITTVNLDATSITAIELTVGNARLGKIKAGAVDTDSMTANTINGNRITANTLVAEKIATGSLTSAVITVGSGGKIQVLGTNSAAIEISGSGISATPSGGGAATFLLDGATGAATFRGSINASAISGSTVTGGTVTGATIQTAIGDIGVVRMNSNGILSYSPSLTPASTHTITMYPGHVGFGTGFANSAGTKHYAFTIITPQGESTASADKSISIPASGGPHTVRIDDPVIHPDATAFRIYRGTSSGVYTQYVQFSIDATFLTSHYKNGANGGYLIWDDNSVAAVEGPWNSTVVSWSNGSPPVIGSASVKTLDFSASNAKISGATIETSASTLLANKAILDSNGLRLYGDLLTAPDWSLTDGIYSGAWTAGQKFWVVTAFNEDGEETAYSEYQTVYRASNSVEMFIDITPRPGAAYYRIYRSSTGSTDFQNAKYQIIQGGGPFRFTDSGDQSGDMPYTGTPPTSATVPLKTVDLSTSQAVITGGIIRSAPSGARAEMNVYGLNTYNDSNILMTRISPQQGIRLSTGYGGSSTIVWNDDLEERHGGIYVGDYGEGMTNQIYIDVKNGPDYSPWFVIDAQQFSSNVASPTNRARFTHGPEGTNTGRRTAMILASSRQYGSGSGAVVHAVVWNDSNTRYVADIITDTGTSTFAFASSDRTKKKNIKNLAVDSVGIIKALRPVSFEWKRSKEKDAEGIEEFVQHGPSTPQAGFIAQEVKDHYPEAIEGEEGSYSVQPLPMLGLIVKTMQGILLRLEAVEAKLA